jgi:predicted metalloprotease with PDZ domain
VPESHHWIEEGTATYVEPIARARSGILSGQRAWFEMVRDMPQGLPVSGDQGLDRTHTWGRTYWGGALFCLLADVEIRKRSANAKGFEDAMRAINRAGGTIDADWPIARVFETGDAATGGKTLMELYEKMRAAPVTVDLPDLWKQLGIERHDRTVTFDDDAPLAVIRKGII